MPNFTKELVAARWKLATIIIGALLISLATIVWDEREFLIRRTIQGPSTIPLNVKAFTNRSPLLLGKVNASVAILWQVDITKNVRQTLVYDTSKGRKSDREKKKAPLFSKLSEENEFALHLINGDTFCGNLVTRSTIGQALLKDNIIFLCRAPIISRESLLIGYVTIGFSERPTDTQRQEAVLALRDIARDMPLAD